MPTTICRFDPQQMRIWSGQTGLCFVSDPQKGYHLAKPFLLRQMKKFLGTGWKKSDTSDEDVLFHIHKLAKAGLKTIILPATFDCFLDPDKTDMWRSMFEDPEIFQADCQNDEQMENVHPDLYLWGSHRRPFLYNIFSLLQILAPGMLVIEHKYQRDDMCITVSRVLPRASWVERNCDVLCIQINGGWKVLVAASLNQEIAFLEVRRESVSSTISSQVSRDAPRNLPFPVTLIQPHCLKSIQAPYIRDRSAEDGKDVFPEMIESTQVADIPSQSTSSSNKWIEQILSQQPQQKQQKKMAAELPLVQADVPFDVTSVQPFCSARPSKDTHIGSNEAESPIAAENNQKATREQKKYTAVKNPLRRLTESRYRIVAGSVLSGSANRDLETCNWLVCSQDCNWCGRCRLVEF